MNMDGRAMQPPPPAAVRDQGQRAVKAPAPRGPVSLPPHIFKDERVKANAVVPLRVDDPTMVRSMTLFPGRIGEVKNGGDEFEIKYDDRTAQVVPAEWIQREDFSWGRTWRDVDEDLAQDKKKKKKRKSPASPPGLHWRLDGFESAFVTPDAEGSMLDRLVFRAKIAYRVKGGQYIQGEEPELLSLRAIVEGQQTQNETDIQVKAMYEMMQILFHATPSQAGRVQMLGDVDPIEDGQAEVAAERVTIYKEHAKKTALMLADTARRQGESSEEEEEEEE